MNLPDFDTFLSPDAIAIVGASSVPTKIGAVPVRYLAENGYGGKIYPINARVDSVAGLRAYPSLQSVGQPIDLAIFAIPAAGAEAALDDAIAAGVKHIVMFSAGFAEAGPEGEAAQHALIGRARAAGIRVLGPNCLGFMNLSRSVYATFSPVVSTGLARTGSIGIVSQSGAFGAYAYAMARERDVGLSAWITTGNEADVDVADGIAWMARDPATRVIMAYLEGCRDGAKLRGALDMARGSGKPVVAVKVGHTSLGALAAASHTAALAGDDAIYDTLLRQHGAWRARTIEEFFDIAHCLATSGLPCNGRVGLLTVSGGVGVMMADAAAEAGLDVPPLPDAVQARIRASVPLAATHNPVDVTGQVTADPSVLEMAARAMLGEANHGSLLIFLAAFGGTAAMHEFQLALARGLRRDFPDRLVMFSTLAEAGRQRELAAQGCCTFADPARAIRVLAAMDFFGRQRQAEPHAGEGAIAPLALAIGKYTEADALRVLGEAGIPVPQVRRAASRAEAMAQAGELAVPVAMKVLSADIAHKSDVGGVALDVRDAQAAGQAYDRIMAAVRAAAPEACVQGVLLAPMVHGGVEVILGARRDPVLGTVVVLGAGGVNAELLADVALRLAPVTHEQAREMIGELKTAPLLRGFRGAPAADERALADAIVRLSRFAVAAGSALDSVEVNPFVVLPDGRGGLALDAVLSTRDLSTPDVSTPDVSTPDVSIAAARAQQAVLATLPLFEMARMRAANTPRRHPTQGFAGDSPTSSLRWVNQFTHTRRLRSPDDKEVVTPNNDTLFTNAWLDLSAGPLVIDVPEMGERYWVLGFLDAWTNPWAYAGRRTTGGQAQRLFVHGPGWTGDVPAGMHRIAAPTHDVWIIGRILADADPADLARVHALQDRFAIRRMDGSPALSRIDSLLDNRETEAPDAAEYLRVLQAMLARNPSPTPLPELPAATHTLQRALGAVYASLREVPQASELGGGWTTAVSVRTSFGDDFETRARVARNWIGTLGVDEAMYIMAEVDEQGDPLTGARRYTLRFPPGAGPQVGAFWSITLYRRSDCLLVPNAIDRHSIGDRTPGLRADRDGGLSIAIQADDPGPDSNWLPAPAGEGFYLTLRLYQPSRAHLEATFDYPPVRRVR